LADQLADRTGLAVVLIVLLPLLLLAMATPPVAYLFGLHLIHRTQARPMWFPRMTRQTVPDKPDHQQRGSVGTVWLGFISLAIPSAIFNLSAN
jgi:cation:H+ antiporter